MIDREFRFGEDVLRFVDGGGVIIVLFDEEVEIGMTEIGGERGEGGEERARGDIERVEVFITDWVVRDDGADILRNIEDVIGEERVEREGVREGVIFA